VKVRPFQWVGCAAAYTVAGLFASGLFGSGLGLVGKLVRFRSGGVLWPICFSGLAAVLAARELGLLEFELPEVRRQTEKVWANEYSFALASAMWGFHLGLGFATWMNYGGLWVLIIVSFATGSPLYGALLMMTYWFGRALPVWIAPAVRAADSAASLESLVRGRLLQQRAVGVGLAWVAISAARIAFLDLLVDKMR
jgi:hypothetical protein